MKVLPILLSLLGIAAQGLAGPPVRAGLKLHFDGANIDGLGNATFRDGQALGEWKDLSETGLHLDAATGSPTFVQPDAEAGGPPVVLFQPADSDGADHLSRAEAPITAYPFTIFAVAGSRTAKNAVIFSFVHTRNPYNMAGIRFVAEGVAAPGRISLYRRNPIWVETPSETPFNDGRLHVISARFIGPTEARLYVDGIEVASSSDPVELPDFDRFDLGNNARNGASYHSFEGRIGEILVYDKDLTDSDRILTERYLTQKWIPEADE